MLSTPQTANEGTMIPVVKHDQYRIALDPETSIVYLSFETIYQGMVEDPVIQLPITPWDCYKKYGHSKFLDWVKRIEDDYQVGRFCRDNPRIYTDYRLATEKETIAIEHCFETNITLIEKEALRLLSLDKPYNFSALCITELLKKGKTIPIDIFCLAFSFYEQKLLLPQSQASILIANASPIESQYMLNNNPLIGCPDASILALGFLAADNDDRRIFYRLAILESLKHEFGFRYLQERVNYYLTHASTLKTNENETPCMHALAKQFKQEFPPPFLFESTKNNAYLPDWIFMEQSLSWERDCAECLEVCFSEFSIHIDYEHLFNLLHLPSGWDWDWHRYSVGQGIKYCNQDPAYFTKNTVKKPKLPIHGYENFVSSVWFHYLRFFQPNLNITREKIDAILDMFASTWNKDTLGT